MTERSLLAVERVPGRYDLYGGRSPLRRPVVVDHPLERIVDEQVDFLDHDLLHVRGRDGTTTYRVLRFALPTGGGILKPDESIGRGALVSVSYGLDPQDDGYVRGWFEGVRETLGEAVDLGALTPTAAFEHLDGAVRRFASDRDLLLDPCREGGP